MVMNQFQRPHFFEGQYLGAADLNGLIEHARNLHARHILGAHTWGIAIGLELKEATEPGTNRLDIYVQPGFAWDGFGRQIVMLEPTPISASLFESIRHVSSDEPRGRLVEVWLRYKEDQTQPPRVGFEVCDAPDSYARWQESFLIEVGPRTTHAERHTPVTVGGRSVDAEQALQTFDSTSPLIRDESIPFQIFPVSGQLDRWLIPLGKVRWHPSVDPTQPGKFEPRDEDDKAQSRVLRRYIGLVAEELHAPAGFVRVHDRMKPYSNVRTDDLLWVEGKLRADGDVRLLGSQLSLLTSSGENDGVPLNIQRGERTATGGKALRVVTGIAEAGANAFEVGPEVGGTFKSRFVVQDNGNVGAGTAQPGARLEVNGGDLLMKAEAEDPGDLIFQNSAGVQKGRIWANPTVGAALHFSSGDNNPDITLDSSGKVGIGTTNPLDKLHVAHGGHLNVILDRTDFNEHLTLVVGSNGSGLRFSDTNEFFIASQQYANRNDGTFGNEHMRIKASGNVGIGTSSPAERLDVRGNIKLGNNGDLFALGSLVNLRLVAGRVSASGSVAAGSGFTVLRNSTGNYTVTFTPAFSGTPIVVASAFEASDDDNIITVRNITTSSFRVLVKDATASLEGQFQDTAFTFISVGSP